jgi:RNA polymerase sigma factor (sigma-70 family)
MPEAADLVRRAVAGDIAAFDALIRQHQSAVRGFLRRITGHDHALSDDLAQETFCVAFSRRQQFVPGSFLSWLYSIAWSRFLMEKRRQKRARAREAMEMPGHSPDTGHAAALDLEKALHHLTAVQCAAITLCLGLGYGHEEAAEILDLPLGTLKSHIARGREKVKLLLEVNKNGN